MPQASLTVTFYFGPGDSPPYRLDKKYLVKHWTDEAHLRRLLDEIGKTNNLDFFSATDEVTRPTRQEILTACY